MTWHWHRMHLPTAKPSLGRLKVREHLKKPAPPDSAPGSPSSERSHFHNPFHIKDRVKRSGASSEPEHLRPQDGDLPDVSGVRDSMLDFSEVHRTWPEAEAEGIRRTDMGGQDLDIVKERLQGQAMGRIDGRRLEACCITVVEARDLEGLALHTHPYLRITRLGYTQQTSVQRNTSNPVWKERTLWLMLPSVFLLEMRNKSHTGMWSIGHAELVFDGDMVARVQSGTQDLWFDLKESRDLTGRTTGQVWKVGVRNMELP